ncbi:uncharacterized protein LOC143293053 [Babylonia areolata]|uniref:uncharacterized protein LOC143293053 n=1 Tax=Babylonia areolata TaxID=304850 RepID=UPI003FD60758
MELQKLREASEKAVAFFTRQLDDGGRLRSGEVAGDLGAVYKLPTLLIFTGNGRLAQKVLTDIKTRFMQKDGDFVSYPDRTGHSRKSDSQPLTVHWPYMNAWVAMAAHRLGRFDISYPAWQFLQKFYNPQVGGFGTSGHYDVTPSTSEGSVLWSGGSRYDVGILITAHLALAALFFGDVEKAKSSGDLLVRMVDQQPALDQYFLLHVDGETGQLVQEGPADHRLFYRLLTTEPNECFYQLGYPVYFLHHLYQATGQGKYLHTAEKILDFLLTCHDGFYTNFLSHKAAWGACLVAMATGKDKYRQMCARCVKHLLSLQTSEGDMLRELGPMASLDQSAEISLWLCEIANALIDKDVI